MCVFRSCFQYRVVKVSRELRGNGYHYAHLRLECQSCPSGRLFQVYETETVKELSHRSQRIMVVIFRFIPGHSSGYSAVESHGGCFTLWVGMVGLTGYSLRVSK